MFPQATTLSAMLATVVELAQAGRFMECAHQWLPSLNQPMPPQARHAAVAQLWYNVLSTLAQGVLVGRGYRGLEPRALELSPDPAYLPSRRRGAAAATRTRRWQRCAR